VEGAAIRDLFAALGPVRARRMFGGQGLYLGDRVFGIEADGEIFLKVDAATAEAFRAAGSRPFVYERGGKAYAMSYWRLPDDALDDPEAAAGWARLAVEASARGGGRKR